MKKTGFASILTAMFVMSTGVMAVPSETDLQRLQVQIREEQQAHQELKQKAISVADEVSSVQRKMVKAASSVQNFEETLETLETRLSDLEKQEADLKKRLSQKEGQLISLMSGLQKMAINPPETMLFQTDNPVQALRSRLLLKESRKPLQATTEKLREDLDTLNSLKAAIRGQASQAKVASVRLENEKENMEKLLKQKFILQTHFEAESRQAKQKSIALAKQAKDLADLLNKLERERQLAAREKPDTAQPSPSPLQGAAFVRSKGNLPLPARGRILQNYGDMTESGMTAKGLTLQTRPSAQVVAPFDGTVLFAGIFKSYGNLIIIEHGEGYHSLLAGLARIDTPVGQVVLTGEPVGVTASNDAAKLYVEIRKDSQPIDPAAWFAIQKQRKK